MRGQKINCEILDSIFKVKNHFLKYASLIYRDSLTSFKEIQGEKNQKISSIKSMKYTSTFVSYFDKSKLCFVTSYLEAYLKISDFAIIGSCLRNRKFFAICSQVFRRFSW